jgi:uncharacterized protein (DUF302 family)
MKKIIAILFLCLAGNTYAADGLLTVVSKHGVKATADMLESKVTAAGFNVVARVNHAKAAKGVGIDLRPTQLLIFGKPAAGSKLMTAGQSAAIDLPMKYLVWKDEGGVVRIGWNDPAWIAGRHQITNRGKLIGKMSGALKKFATEAAM